MPTPETVRTSAAGKDRRAVRSGKGFLAGVQVRCTDIEPTKGLHSVLFRAMAGLLGLLVVVQVVLGLTSAVPISYGVLFAEAIRLVIFAGLLWGAGDLADLFIQSHCDLRSARILLSTLRMFKPRAAPHSLTHAQVRILWLGDFPRQAHRNAAARGPNP